MKPKRLATQNTTPTLNSQVSGDRKVEDKYYQLSITPSLRKNNWGGGGKSCEENTPLKES